MNIEVWISSHSPNNYHLGYLHRSIESCLKLDLKVVVSLSSNLSFKELDLEDIYKLYKLFDKTPDIRFRSEAVYSLDEWMKNTDSYTESHQHSINKGKNVLYQFEHILNLKMESNLDDDDYIIFLDDDDLILPNIQDVLTTLLSQQVDHKPLIDYVTTRHSRFSDSGESPVPYYSSDKVDYNTLRRESIIGVDDYLQTRQNTNIDRTDFSGLIIRRTILDDFFQRISRNCMYRYKLLDGHLRGDACYSTNNIRCEIPYIAHRIKREIPYWMLYDDYNRQFL